MPGRSAAFAKPCAADPDRRPLKDLENEVVSSALRRFLLGPRGLSLAGARRNRWRQRKAVVRMDAAERRGLRQSSCPRSSHARDQATFSFLRRCAIGVLVSALKVRPQLLQRNRKSPSRAAPTDDLAARAMGTALSRDALDARRSKARPRADCPLSSSNAQRRRRRLLQRRRLPPPRCASRSSPKFADSQAEKSSPLIRSLQGKRPSLNQINR